MLPQNAKPRSYPTAALLAGFWLACGAGSASGVESSRGTVSESRDAGTTSESAPSTVDAAVGDAAPQCVVSATLPSWKLTANGTRLVDALGRQVVLRGVNAGGHGKQPPHYAPFDFAPGGYDAALASYMDRAASWGIDVLRVPFMWAAVEPQKGVDDQAFLQRFDALLDAAWARGIWTIVDFHQDVYAEALCGDGFPAWTLAQPAPPAKTGCDNWFALYQTDATVKSSFDRFWNDTDGIRTAFAALWDRMVLRYRDRPGVIGFEVLNEPGWGNAVLPVFEATTLTDFYSTMATRIQAQAPNALVFFDLPGIDALTVSTSLRLPTGSNLVFAPHYYQAATFAGLAGDTTKVLPNFKTWAERGNQWKVPTFVGEFGVSHDAPSPAAYVSAQFAALDALEIHGAQWEYSVSTETWNGEALGIVRGDGSEYPGIVDALVRVYPRAVAGSDPKFSYDAARRIFSLTYAATAGGVTEVVAPARLYPNGIAITADGACADTTSTSKDGVARIMSAKGGPVRVVIAPR